MKKSKSKTRQGLVPLIIILVLILSLVQLYISYNLSTAGVKVKALEEKSLVLEKANRQLNQEISQVGSLTSISLKATELGLVRTTQVLHLIPQVPVALK